MEVGFYAPNLEAVKLKIDVLKLNNNVSLLDWTSREDVFHIIEKSKLYISTSRYEGLPYALIETLVLGKLIVTTDCDGNRDLVINNYNGFLIKNYDKYNMSKQLLKIINDKDLNNSLSMNSFKLFEEKFNLIKNIKKLENIYHQNC